MRRGVEEGGPEWGPNPYVITGVENGLVTSGYTNGFYSVFEMMRVNKSDLTTLGVNVEYQINDSGQ